MTMTGESQPEAVRRGSFPVAARGPGRLLFLAACLLVLPFLPSAQADEAIVPHLLISPSPATAETNEIVQVHVTSMVAGLDEGGNLTLVPSTHLINWTVTDVQHGVVVARGAIPLFLGRGTFQVPIDPLWSDTLLNVTAVDYASGLIAFADIRTDYSQTYMIYLNEVTVRKTVAEPIALLLAENAASRAYNNWMTILVTALFLVLMTVLFLKADHRRSRSVFAPSLADRLKAFFWRWTLVDDFLDDYFDPVRTWDPVAALHWQEGRVRAHIRELRHSKRNLYLEIKALEKQLQGPTRIGDAPPLAASILPLPDAKPVNP